MSHARADRRVGRVLVADEDAAARGAWTGAIRWAGLSADEAGSPQEAIEWYNQVRYDAVLMSARLAAPEGADLLGVLSELCGHGRRVSLRLPQGLPPILVLAEDPRTPESRRLLFSERVVGVLRRSIDARRLVQLVNEVLREEDIRARRMLERMERDPGRKMRASGANS